MTPRRHALASLVSAALIAMAAAVAFAPFASAQGDRERAERILNVSCQDCHSLRAIHTQARTRDEWAATVKAEIERGAKVAPDDIPVLVDYLARQHGPLPEGPGRRVLLNICTMCHDLGRIKLGRRSPEEWEETLISMLNEGAPLSDEDFVLVHEYLSEHFGVD